jgi:hypothetical protein
MDELIPRSASSLGAGIAAAAVPTPAMDSAAANNAAPTCVRIMGFSRLKSMRR